MLSFYIGDPAFEHAVVSNNDLVPMNHIAVKLSTFRLQDAAVFSPWFGPRVFPLVPLRSCPVAGASSPQPSRFEPSLR